MHYLKKIHFIINVILLTASSILFLGSCAKNINDTPVSKTGFAFDTVVTITVYDKEKSNVLDACFDLCETYEALFSATRANSEVWKINHSGGMPVAVSFDTAALIQAALFWCDTSDGALDLTLLPIAEEWHIKEQMTQVSENPDYEYDIPDASTLNRLLTHVNYKNVVIYDENGTAVAYDEPLSREASYRVQLLDRNAAIDLGFLAKGYIADRLKEFMISKGVESGVISLGGNILLIGKKPDGSAYQIGIQKPFGNAGELIDTVQETDTSVVSSGCYERYFSLPENGRIYHHIFDTVTGAPVQNNLLGVTIICDSSLQGDALSTYCYILGLEKGMKFVQSLDGVDAVFVTQDYEVIKSPSSHSGSQAPSDPYQAACKNSYSPPR